MIIMNEKIKSASEFLNSLKGDNIESSNNIFFRGHSDEKYDLEPSIYRKGDTSKTTLYIDNEDKIYREMITKLPYEFKDKTTIESLALMQHYGVPTRILDLTTNALVALYFACTGNNDKDGEVLVFDISEENICYSDSDRVTILANLAKCDKDFFYKKELLPLYEQKLKFLENKKNQQNIIDYNYQSVLDYIDSKRKEIEKYLADVCFDFETNIDERIEGWINEYSGCKEVYYRNEIKNKILDIIWDVIKNVSIPYTISIINERYFGKLLHNIKDDKSYFQPIINPNDVGSVFAIRPKLDNPRIIRQQGAFLIFGVKEKESSAIGSGESIKSMAKINDNWIIRGKKTEGENQRIIIESESKKQILKELEMLGINEATLFPEIDIVAKYVKTQYAS